MTKFQKLRTVIFCDVMPCSLEYNWLNFITHNVTAYKSVLYIHQTVNLKS